MTANIQLIDLLPFLISFIKIVAVIFAVILPMVAYSVWAERRVSAIIQERVGPNRVGIPFTKIGLSGLGQPIACLLYTSPSPRDATLSRMPSSA